MSGSNQEAEFSAYEEGCQALLGEVSAPDVWLIVNDRLPVYGAECLWAVTPEVLRFADAIPIASGTIDFLPDHFQLCDRPFRCYIRSNYILFIQRSPSPHRFALCDSGDTICHGSAPSVPPSGVVIAGLGQP